MMMNLAEILVRACKDAALLTDENLKFLLQLKKDTDREQLFQAARQVREAHFGNKIFLYGFVYFSTYCRNHCTFCYYRQANAASPRYRKSPEEVVRAAAALADSGVQLIDLTMGEDPYYLSDGAAGYDRLVGLVEQVRIRTGLPVMISPGVVPPEVLRRLQQAGASWYACYQETHTRSLYERLRLRQPYEERWQAKLAAQTSGLCIEEGLLVGMGETTSDLVHSLRVMQSLGAQQVRTMTFIPQQGTPLEENKRSGYEREIDLIAVMRLLMPDRLIPASLDVEGISGLKQRLQAGANVVTSLIPPTAGLAGVAQATLDIADSARTVSGIAPVLAACGLQSASREEYLDWLQPRMKEEGIA